MATSVVRPRRLMFTGLAACVLAAGLLVVSQGPSARASSPVAATAGGRGAAVASVLVVRRAVDHDALWLLSPVDGTPTAAGDLPGFAGAVAVSPDGQNVAYLPEKGAARVWIGFGPLAPRSISLAGVGVKRADSFCWIDANRLLVSGVTKATAGLLQRPALPRERRDRQGPLVPGSLRDRAERGRSGGQGRVREADHHRAPDGQSGPGHPGEPQGAEPESSRRRAYRLVGAVSAVRGLPRVLAAAGLARRLVVPHRPDRQRRARDLLHSRSVRLPAAVALRAGAAGGRRLGLRPGGGRRSRACRSRRAPAIVPASGSTTPTQGRSCVRPVRWTLGR